jgi:hypothetical protein
VVSMSSASNTANGSSHGATRRVRSVAGSTTPGTGFVGAPVGFAGEGCVVEAVEGVGASAVDEGGVADEGDVVDCVFVLVVCFGKRSGFESGVRRRRLTSEVPDTGVNHAVGGEGHGCSNNSAGENIVPVVVFVNGQSTANEHGAEDGHVENNELPHRGVVVGENLQLCVKIEVKEDESSKGSSGVTRRHRLQAVVDLILVTSADLTIVHDLAVPITDLQSSDVGLANSEEVRTQSTDEPLDEDLEDGSGNERVQ